MAYSNQQRGKKIKVEDDDANHHNQEQILCHDFWNEAPEELLTEIFVRLLDSRLAARASTVCRRWHSLIRQNPRQFIEQFKSHHPTEYSLPWAVVFRPDQCSESNTSHSCSDEWLFLHGKLPAKFFDFLPSSPNLCIKASCNDLFLVGGNNDDLYICNPTTEQFVHLPAGPRLEDTTNGVQIAYAVVPTPLGPTANKVGFKVVKILLFNRHSSFLEHYDRIVQVAVFCPVSRKWETRILPCPGVDSGWYDGFHYTNNIVTVDGVMYWLSRRDHGKILLYLDLSKDKCGAIGFPGPTHMFRDHNIGAIPMSDGSHELRLLEVSAYAKEIEYLTVWRLSSNNNRDDGDSNLIIVYDKMTLARPENLSDSFKRAFVHPTNGDLLLCVWGKNVIEYNLVHSTYKKIAELSKISPWSGLKPPFLMVSASSSPAGLEI